MSTQSPTEATMNVPLTMRPPVENLPMTNALAPNHSGRSGSDLGMPSAEKKFDKPVEQSLQRILVVEDEDEIRELIVLHLKRDRLIVDAAPSVEAALDLFAKNEYSVLALDWMLPGASGVQFAKVIRSGKHNADVSILMITARAESADIVEGLEAGADDYLTKPFEPAVLMARVRALLRRRQTLLQMRSAAVTPGSAPVTPAAANQGAQTQSSALSFESGRIQMGQLVLNTETYVVRCGNEPIQLTPSEFKLLVTLAHNRGRVLTRDSLIEHVQGEGVSVVGRTVDTHVFGLRKKLGECADVIETVRGVGYRVRAD